MPMSRNGKDDMFWDQPFDAEAVKKWCWDTWRVVPRPMWPEINWGGRHIESASNIVFSNGKLDPWSGGGILEVCELRRAQLFMPITCSWGQPTLQNACVICRTSTTPWWLCS